MATSWRRRTRGAACADTSPLLLENAERMDTPAHQNLLAYLHSARRPVALTCATDPIAVSLLPFLQANGQRVPEDVAVTGFDNLQLSARTSPALTTVQQDFSALAQISGELLLTAMEVGGAPRRSSARRPCPSWCARAPGERLTIYMPHSRHVKYKMRRIQHEKGTVTRAGAPDGAGPGRGALAPAESTPADDGGAAAQTPADDGGDAAEPSAEGEAIEISVRGLPKETDTAGKQIMEARLATMKRGSLSRT